MNKSLLISYCILAITCFGCLFSPPYDFLFLITLVVTLTYAVLGALKVGLTESEWMLTLADDDRDWIVELEKYYQVFGHLLPLLALPSLVASMWLHQNLLFSNFGIIHALIGVGTSVAIAFKGLNRDIVDMLVIGNSASLVFIGLLTRNVYAIYSDIFFIIAHFCTYHTHRTEEGRVTIEDLYQYFLVAFIHFALRCANESRTNYYNAITEEIRKEAAAVAPAPAPLIINDDKISLDIDIAELKENIMTGVKQITESICKLKKYMHY